jgi:hypothetical protein
LTIDAFNITNATFITSEGNNSVALWNGLYRALYSFEGDAEDSEPAGWTVTCMSHANLSVRNQATYHRNVVRLWAYQSDTAKMKNDWGQDRENGTVELWIRGTPDNDNTEIELMDGNNQGTYLWFDWGTGKLEAYTDTFVTLASIVTNAWYHLRINFTITTWVKNFDVFLNKSQVGTDVAFMVNRTHLDSIRITETGVYHGNSISYIDAVDYSWADGYSLNRNWNSTYFDAGAWISPIYDLGAVGITYDTLTTIADIPADSGLALYAQVSADGEDWGMGWFSVPLNHSFGSPGLQYFQGMLNFTVSSDFLETPSLLCFELSYNATILNEYPQLGTIDVTFDNETLEATISCLITDPDADNCTITLCLPLGDIEQTVNDVINGTTIEFLVNCTYSTNYSYFLNVTDSEDAVQSSLFGWSTGAEPEEPPVTPIIYADLYDYTTVGIVLVMSFVFLSVLSTKKFK